MVFELVTKYSTHAQDALCQSLFVLNFKRLCNHYQLDIESYLLLNYLGRVAFIALTIGHLDLESFETPTVFHVEEQTGTAFQSVSGEREELAITEGISDPNVAILTDWSVCKALAF